MAVKNAAVKMDAMELRVGCYVVRVQVKNCVGGGPAERGLEARASAARMAATQGVI